MFTPLVQAVLLWPTMTLLVLAVVVVGLARGLEAEASVNAEADDTANTPPVSATCVAKCAEALKRGADRRILVMTYGAETVQEAEKPTCI